MTGNRPFKDVDGQEIFSVKREKEQNMIMWWSYGFSIADYLSKVISRRDNIWEPRWMVQWLILTVFGEYKHKKDGIQIKTLWKPIHMDGISNVLDVHDGSLMCI